MKGMCTVLKVFQMFFVPPPPPPPTLDPPPVSEHVKMSLKKSVFDRPQMPQERSKTAHGGPKSGQDRLKTGQGRRKSTHIGPQSGPRPPADGLRAAQDNPQKL